MDTALPPPTIFSPSCAYISIPIIITYEDEKILWRVWSKCIITADNINMTISYSYILTRKVIIRCVYIIIYTMSA